MKGNGQPRLAIIGRGAVVRHHLISASRRIGWLPLVLADPSRKNRGAATRLIGNRALKAVVADWHEAADTFDAAIVAVRSSAVPVLSRNALDSSPKPLHDIVARVYFGTGARRLGKIHRPDPRQLPLWAEKARRVLGHQPVVEFATGNQSTGLPLNWAYGHEARPVARSQPARQRPIGPGRAESVTDAH